MTDTEMLDWMDRNPGRVVYNERIPWTENGGLWVWLDSDDDGRTAESLRDAILKAASDIGQTCKQCDRPAETHICGQCAHAQVLEAQVRIEGV